MQIRGKKKRKWLQSENKKRFGKLKMAKTKKTKNMWAIISIVLGIIVIAAPEVISLAIGLYLIITGILNLTGK